MDKKMKITRSDSQEIIKKILHSEIIYEDKPRGTRLYNSFLDGEKFPMEVTETSELSLLEKWIDQCLKQKPKFICFSLNPKIAGQSIASLHLLCKSSAIIFKPSLGSTSLPQPLQEVLQRLDIEFISYNLVKRWSRLRVLNQFGLQLFHNVKFLAQNDDKLDWKKKTMQSLVQLVKRKKFVSDKGSSTWSGGFLTQASLDYSLCELLLCQEAGSLRHSGAR